MVRIARNCDIPNLSKIVEDTFDSVSFFEDDTDCEMFDMSDAVIDEVGE